MILNEGYSPEFNRSHVEFLQLNSVIPKNHDFLALNPALRTHILSGTAETECTMLVNASPSWCFPYEMLFTSDVELLVLSGNLTINGRCLTQGYYAFIDAFYKISNMSSTAGASILWMSNGPAEWVLAEKLLPRENAELRVIDTNQVPWKESPAYEGRTVDEVIAGLSVKLIRQDVVTSAYTLMTRHQPGWIDPRMEAHDTWEELVLIQGDYLMGTTGRLEGGSYIFRPPIRPHGPQATLTGAIWFCRGEKEIDFQYHEESWVDDHIGTYFGERNMAITSETKPWGDWWGS
jgi:hypothetical protein